MEKSMCCGILLLLISVFLLPSSGKSISPANVPNDTCSQPIDGGDCMAYFIRWFFNNKTKSCQTFVFGGCGGNDNKFHTQTACETACKATHALKALGNVPKKPSPKVIMNIKGPCFKASQKAKENSSKLDFIPSCDEKGFYRDMQCSSSIFGTRCWCVDQNGLKVGEVNTTSDGKQTCNKLDKAILENRPCFQARNKANDASVHVPKCNQLTGYFKPRQCLKKKCWCVDKWGNKIKNTEGIRGHMRVKCGKLQKRKST